MYADFSCTFTYAHLHADKRVQKNVGRILANEDEVVKAVKAVNVANVQVVDTAKMSFTEQLTLIRHTNVLIGIHGAGLMFIMFAAEEVGVGGPLIFFTHTSSPTSPFSTSSFWTGDIDRSAPHLSPR